MEETKWSEQINRGGSDNTNSINSPKPNIHIKKLIDSRAKISQRVINWRRTSQTDWKKWMTLKRKVVKLFEISKFSFELNKFSFQSCSIFQSVWLVGRQLRIHFSTFWDVCPITITESSMMNKCTKMSPKMPHPRVQLLTRHQHCWQDFTAILSNRPDVGSPPFISLYIKDDPS